MPVIAGVAVLLLVVALPSSVAAADRDCSDFANQRAAQRYFESQGGPGRDRDRLDGDNNGRACDSLPCPCTRGKPGARPRSTPRPLRIAARISSVIDGDTLRARSLVSGRGYTVRMVGIDTPETIKPGKRGECGSVNAVNYLGRLSFLNGRGVRVTLTTDVTQDRRDRYGRLLAYVTRRDGKNLGEAQLRAGWAKVYVFEHPFKLVERFRAAARSAKRSDRGVWGRCDGDFHSPA